MIGGRSIGIVILVLVGAAVILSGVAYYQGGDSAFGSIRELGARIASRVGGSSRARPAGNEGEYDPGIPAREGSVTDQDPQASTTATTSASSGTVLRVKLNKLTVHRCPGYDCEILSSLPLGTKVVLLGDRDGSLGEEWCRVRAGKVEGWVSRYYLE